MTSNPTIQRTKVFDFSDPSLWNTAYLPVFQRNERFIHLYGSAGSGKSNFAFQREIVESFDARRNGRNTLVVRQVHDTHKHSTYAKILEVLAEWELTDEFEITRSPLSITNKHTGVGFIFRGMDNPEKIKSVTGVDRILIEEATELKSPKVLTQLSLRLRGMRNPSPQITLCYNPVDVFHWLNTDFHEARPEGHWILKTTYKDNRFLDAEYLTFLESLKDADSNYYQIYVLGNWGTVVEGLIYPHYKTGCEFPDVQFYGLDFGYSEPTALVEMAVTDALPRKRLSVREVLYKPGLNAERLIKEFNEIGVRRDLKIIADSARPEMIESLKQAGYSVYACDKGDGSVLSGINRIRDYDLEIAANSRNIVREISNYKKRQLPSGAFVEEPALHQQDHALDAIRYGEQAVRAPSFKQTIVRF